MESNRREEKETRWKTRREWGKGDKMRVKDRRIKRRKEKGGGTERRTRGKKLRGMIILMRKER
jgi:hypothetical protein